MEQIQVNQNTYTVIRLLGKGKGGYSYLVTDGSVQYVLKQIHHEPCSYYSFGDKLASELRDYAHLQKIGIPMPKLLEADTQNERILKEYIHGDTVDRLVLQNKMQPEYYRQIKSMCEKLYAADTNIDYYPTNFIVQEGTLFYIDYECNPYMEQWDFEHWGSKYWWKTPEFLEAFQK